MLKNDIHHAVEILRRGGLVAFPTETVYGLGADASNPEAVDKIFQAKNRPRNHPLIVHIGSREDLFAWSSSVPPMALLLAEAFWPGPLTLILKKAPHVSLGVTGGQNTIGLRMPNHPVALELLREFGSGIAGPSANRFQRISPTSREAVIEELENAIDLVLEGGDCQVGVESTIVDVSTKIPVILRPGIITADEISEVLGMPLGDKKINSPKVSGSHRVHYAPKTKTIVMSRAEMENGLVAEKKTALLLLSALNVENASVFMMPNNAKAYAKVLYHTLRDVDKKGFEQIVIESLPLNSEWEAVRDRVGRAGVCC